MMNVKLLCRNVIIKLLLLLLLLLLISLLLLLFCSAIVADILLCEEITWSNLINGDAWFDGKNIVEI